MFLNANGLMSTAQLGLVLLYAAQLQRAGMDFMVGITTLETAFVSVERIAEYTRLESEADNEGQLSDAAALAVSTVGHAW